MKPKRERERIPQSQVLAWLQEHHPNLQAEIDRAWLWISTPLPGDDKKPIRESLKEYGFIFSRRGGHPRHCPNSGEPFETHPDTSAGSQRYVEDCAVCCRPIEVSLRVDADAELLDVSPATDRD